MLFCDKENVNLLLKLLKYKASTYIWYKSKKLHIRWSIF